VVEEVERVGELWAAGRDNLMRGLAQLGGGGTGRWEEESGGAPGRRPVARSHSQDGGAAKRPRGWAAVRLGVTEKRRMPSGGQSWMMDGGGKEAWTPLPAGLDVPALRARSRQLQTVARAEGTRVSYAHWWMLFALFLVELQWAQNVEMVPLPVPVALVDLWVAFLSEHYAESTIAISLAAVSAVHDGHGLASPTLARSVRGAMAGVANTCTVRGVIESVVVLPQHVQAFARLSAVRVDGRVWSQLRRLRAVAMVVIGFMAFLRKSEVTMLDRCDVVREANCTKVRVGKAKNDPAGRGRQSIIGAGCGDSAELEQAIWDWVDVGCPAVSTQCTKAANPRARCTACGPLFVRLGGRDVRVTKTPIAKNTLTTELRGLYHGAQAAGVVEDSFDPRRVSAISLRRGGNTAATAAGCSAILRAAAGRWRSVDTPDQSYVFLHETEMVGMATTMLQPRL